MLVETLVSNCSVHLCTVVFGLYVRERSVSSITSGSFVLLGLIYRIRWNSLALLPECTADSICTDYWVHQFSRSGEGLRFMCESSFRCSLICCFWGGMLWRIGESVVIERSKFFHWICMSIGCWKMKIVFYYCMVCINIREDGLTETLIQFRLIGGWSEFRDHSACEWLVVVSGQFSDRELVRQGEL